MIWAGKSQHILPMLRQDELERRSAPPHCRKLAIVPGDIPRSNGQTESINPLRLYLVRNSRSAFSEELPMPQSVTPTNTPARRLLAMLDHKFAPPNRDGFHRFNTVRRDLE